MQTVLQVIVALVLVVSRYWRGRATPSPGVHPLAVGHPPGSGLGVVADQVVIARTGVLGVPVQVYPAA